MGNVIAVIVIILVNAAAQGSILLFGKGLPRKARLALQVIVLLLGTLGPLIQIARDRDEARRRADSGILSSGVRPGIQDPLTVLVGTNTFVLGPIGGPDGIPYNLSNLFGEGGGLPVSVRIASRGVLVSAEVTSWDGSVAAEMHENEWRTASHSFDRNYDRRALEVIDRFGIPVLQVELTGRSGVRVAGVFYNDSRITVIGERGVFLSGRPSSVDEMRRIVRDQKVAPWFQYPGDRHVGERAR